MIENNKNLIREKMYHISSHQISLPAPVIQRGFWLYVWKIWTSKQKIYLYVGRTGDSSSSNAQSPFSRMAQHMGNNIKSNALLRNMKKNGIDAILYEFICFGPIFEEQQNKEDHEYFRDKIAALEKKLANYLNEDLGYNVINQVHSRKILDEEIWDVIKNEIDKKFQKIDNN